MSGFVLDASAMLAWCFEDERPRDADAVLERLVSGGLAAPSHWPLEVTNILHFAEKRGRIASADVTAFLSLVRDLGVEIDGETSQRAWSDIRSIAREEQLTTYDAAYLDLAIRRQSVLVSKDADLLQAAVRRGVAVVDLR